MLLTIVIIALMPLRPAVAAMNGQSVSTTIPAAEPKLDPRIPPADPKQYSTDPDERNWKNPRLDVTTAGFWLLSRSTPGKRFVTVIDLRRVLTALPVSDWPYGRVVVVQLPSLGGDEQWLKAEQTNEIAARDILKALDARAFGWPP